MFRLSPQSRIAVAVWWTVAFCAIDSTATAGGVDFTNDVAPVLTKLNCNSGGCHGKATGRGGFRLSLFGFEPEKDHTAIARESYGRRVLPTNPERSLLLLKATMQIPHGGGKRMDRDSPEYRVLQRWIKQGARWGDAGAPRIRRIEIVPDSARLAKNQSLQIAVTGVYSDGSRRDVTRWTRFQCNDSSVATVTGSGLVVTQKRTGETAVVALYQGEVATTQVTVPRRNPSAADKRRLAKFAPKNLIDKHVRRKLTQLGVPPAASTNDSAFLRRVTLQIAGRLPTLKETLAFRKNKDPRRREKLVDRLLADDGYADHFAQKWCDVLRIKRRGQKTRIPGTKAFHGWVRKAIADNMPYDRFVRAIITAKGKVPASPTVQWYAEVRYLDRYVDDTAQVFLGMRIGCARCHHHPFEKISQDDYYGLAAFFARVGRKGGTGVAERRANEIIFVKPTGTVKHPVTGKPVPPSGLGGKPLSIAKSKDPRHKLVDWMANPRNPYFARAFVNRCWSHFFGRGLVEPLDDMRATNPAANEPLLDALAKEFVRSRYDMKHIVRLICTSATYQLSSQADASNLGETQNHARFYPQRIKAEVLLDAIDQATGVKTKFSGLPAGTRALQLPDEGYSNEFLRLFGRPNRESACECERPAEPSLSQSLFVMNNRFVLDKTTSSRSYAARLAADKRDSQAKVRELFLTVFSREPNNRELAEAVRYLKSESNARTAWGNLLWALLNTKEFMYVH